MYDRTKAFRQDCHTAIALPLIAALKHGILDTGFLKPLVQEARLAHGSEIDCISCGAAPTRTSYYLTPELEGLASSSWVVHCTTVRRP